jgi:hypothetical protein
MCADGTVIARVIDRWGPAPRAFGTEDLDAVAVKLHRSDARVVYQIAYNARCEWSDVQVRA